MRSPDANLGLYKVGSLGGGTKKGLGVQGSPVEPCCLFYLGVSLLKPNKKKTGILIIKGLLGNLDKAGFLEGDSGLDSFNRFLSGYVHTVPP